MQSCPKVHRHVPFQVIADLKQSDLQSLLKAVLAAWRKRGEDNG
jgi:hypothetical protein